MKITKLFTVEEKISFFVKSPSDVLSLQCVKDLANESQENFCVLTLDGAHSVISFNVCTVGTVNHSLVHPREVFRKAIEDNAASIIIFHNHPSGRTNPSEEDLEVTENLKKASEIIGIQIIDHIIIGKYGYFSFTENDIF